ncbi:unnamed protein product [Didymodactylos carnosus]|nr:unnamed protein product [Didymodactylos carnosus]CAF3987689.1 unnamed protein product [Didymodactylos carnosus]
MKKIAMHGRITEEINSLHHASCSYNTQYYFRLILFLIHNSAYIYILRALFQITIHFCIFAKSILPKMLNIIHHKVFDRFLSKSYENASAKRKIRARSNSYNDENIPHQRHTKKDEAHVLFAGANNQDIVYNWSGINVIAHKTQLIIPNTIEQISQLARDTRSKISVMGTGLSYEQIMSIHLKDPQALLICMQHFNGLIEMREESAVFGAATPINDIIKVLGEHDRMMPCSPGVIGIQTIAGSIATGTHGQGLYQSSYADIVQSLTVVLPNGDIVKIDGSHKDFPLEAFITSIGMLGIVVNIEIAHVPRKVFSCRKMTVDIDEFLSNYQQWNEENEYVKVWWFPKTDLCHVWLVDEADPSQTQDFLCISRSSPIESKSENKSMNVTVRRYIDKMSHDTKSSSTSSQPQFETLKRFASVKDLVGYSEQILCKGIPVPQINCEIAVPFSRARDATLALRKWCDENEDRLHYPFIYRTTGQSRAWLNPAFSGPVCYIGFLIYIASDGTTRADGMHSMLEIQKILANHKGLPHWGKHFVPSVYNFRRDIPMYNQFKQLRTRVDPKKKMMSKFLQDIFD